MRKGAAVLLTALLLGTTQAPATGVLANAAKRNAGPGAKARQPTAVAPEPKSTARSDFDGNGFDDLAIGAYIDKIGPIDSAGSVTILYGHRGGLSSKGADLFTQNTDALNETAEEFDYFGLTLAAGDFNGDGFSDLAVGAPGESNPLSNGLDGAGIVHILYGSANGLRATGSEALAGSGAYDHFGHALAAIDYFNGVNKGKDGFADLAVGIPYGSTTGQVTINNGGPEGIVGNTPEVSSTVGAGGTGARYGSSLAVGDFNSDGKQELAVGAPQEDVSGQFYAGAVHIFGEALTITQDTPGIPEVVEQYDLFGNSLAAGDFDANGKDDLAVGSPGEGVGGKEFSGTATVIPTLGGALAPDKAKLIHQDKPGIPGSAHNNESFGDGLAAANMGHGPAEDLAIGEAGARIDGLPYAGRAVIVYGSDNGVALRSAKGFDQGTPGIADNPEKGDGFGVSFSTGRFDKGGAQDLAIGASTEGIGYFAKDAGAVHVLYSKTTGLSADGSQFWRRGFNGVPGRRDLYERFGEGLFSSTWEELFI